MCSNKSIFENENDVISKRLKALVDAEEKQEEFLIVKNKQGEEKKTVVNNK